MGDLAAILIFAKSATVGLLVGLERERHTDAKAGLRTFTLIALSGTLFACLAERMGSAWLPAAGLLVIGGMLVAAHARNFTAESDPGTTTIAAAAVTYGLGALLWYGYTTLAIAVALATTALLYFRTELHGVTHRISRQDLVSFLQFAVLAFVLLPVLPDRALGSHEILNPYRVGLLVVLISGLSFAGYIALRIFGERRGVWLVGLFGGMTSSTATTLIYARHAARNEIAAAPAALVVLVANLALLIRLTLIAAILSPAVLAKLGWVLGISFVAGGIYTFWYARLQAADGHLPTLQIKNPVELRAAVVFTLLFVSILFAVSWMNQHFGTPGVYSAAALSGLADLDAISLSTLKLANTGGIAPRAAAIAIVIAYSANLALKLVFAWFLGTREFALRTAPGFIAAAAGAFALLFIG